MSRVLSRNHVTTDICESMRNGHCGLCKTHLHDDITDLVEEDREELRTLQANLAKGFRA
ncbi:MAG: hypothetical protein JWN71_1458 [Xanthobacteraceae bacterium]|jgi:hypothetical protein|nr:hypothetical protein [Xanthobacteraceae bacterium]